MQIESIEQAPLDQTETIVTTVVFNHVESSCILARLMIDWLGKPGKDTDLELMGGNHQWVASWTYPYFSVEEMKEKLSFAN
ncbi:MAG: hypothetical protein AB4041_13920 [Microcystaceae cyanobacterium]